MWLLGSNKKTKYIFVGLEEVAHSFGLGGSDKFGERSLV